MTKPVEPLNACQKLHIADAINDIVEKATPDNEAAVDVLLLCLRARLSEFEYRVSLKALH